MSSAMRKVSLRGLAAHKVRFSLTVLSVVLGTAFIAASFVFTQMLGKSFDDIVELSTDGVAVQVQPTEELSAGVPLALVDTVRAVDGVRAVEPSTSGAGHPHRRGRQGRRQRRRSLHRLRLGQR